MAALARFHSSSSYLFFNSSRAFASNSPPVNDDAYQYLERSVIPTMHFQKSLPRLPIPKLEKSMHRYLNAVKPIFDDAQFEKAQKLANDFEHGPAKELHESVVKNDKKNKDTSYISEPWFDMYLKARTPIAINYNPFMAWTPDPNPKYNDQLTRATNLIISACRFKRSLDIGALSPEVYHMNPAKSDTPRYRQVIKVLPPSVSWYGSYFMFKAFPLDMSQYPSLFNSTRIPVIGKDQLKRFPNGRHVLVLRKGHFFAVEVLDENGQIKSPQEVQAGIAHVLSLPLEPNKQGLGILTSMERDKWAEARSQLIQEGNEASLQLIDSALFVLALDDAKTGDDPVATARNLLHSDGSNRWFDKSFTIIVQGDGLSAINFEHAWGDGVAVLRLMEDLHKDTCKHHWVGPDTKPANVDLSKAVKKIDFKISPAVQNTINEASSKFSSWCKNLQYGTLEYTKMNRDSIKKQKISPDAVMQAAIQVAFYRQYQKRAPTYESCSTAAFKKGRTETVRSATAETKKFTDAILSKNKPSAGELRKLLEDCSKKHSDLVKDAAMGQGFDRHLFALKYEAEKRGSKIPEFFTDDTYQYANRYILSTSTLSTETVLIGGFGPVVPDGFGIGYNVGEKKLGCIVSAYADTRNANEFVQCLEKSLDEIREVFEKSAPTPNPK